MGHVADLYTSFNTMTRNSRAPHAIRTRSRWRVVLPASVAAAALALVPLSVRGADKGPSLALRVSPQTAFVPARITARAEVRGGPDDAEDFYCAATEWVWGDGTTSENGADCDPYERGRSTIRRFYSAEHVYRIDGGYRIELRLRKNRKVVATAAAVVQIRPGLGGQSGR